MPSIPLRLPDDIPTSLSTLIELFCTDALRVRCVAVETAHTQILYLIRFFRHIGLPDSREELARRVSPGLISTFLMDYVRQNRPGSIRWMQVSLRAFLRFAYHSELFDRDLSALVPVRSSRRLGTVPRSLPDEIIAQLCNGIDCGSSTGLRDAAIMGLLSIYGIRGVQIRRLRLDGIDWRNERIRFPAAKGGRAVEQHLMPEAGNLLCAYLRSGRPDSEHPEVFLTLREPFRPLPNASYLSDTIKRHIERLGLELPAGVRPGSHGFRHAFASRMVGKIPFKDLIDQLGHRDPASTLIYSKVDTNGLRQAALPWPGGAQ